MKNNMSPIHPGEILQDELTELQLSIEDFANKIALPSTEIELILTKKSSLTKESAQKLANFFGTTAKFWLNLQKAYDEKVISRL